VAAEWRLAYSAWAYRTSTSEVRFSVVINRGQKIMIPRFTMKSLTYYWVRDEGSTMEKVNSRFAGITLKPPFDEKS
jgi:hypothetical protein